MEPLAASGSCRRWKAHRQECLWHQS